MTPNLAQAIFNLSAIKSAACVLIMREGKALAISRRNNHSQWGLPGGKVAAALVKHTFLGVPNV